MGVEVEVEANPRRSPVHAEAQGRSEEEARGTSPFGEAQQVGQLSGGRAISARALSTQPASSVRTARERKTEEECVFDPSPRSIRKRRCRKRELQPQIAPVSLRYVERPSSTIPDTPHLHSS